MCNNVEPMAYGNNMIFFHASEVECNPEQIKFMDNRHNNSAEQIKNQI